MCLNAFTSTPGTITEVAMVSRPGPTPLTVPPTCTAWVPVGTAGADGVGVESATWPAAKPVSLVAPGGFAGGVAGSEPHAAATERTETRNNEGSVRRNIGWPSKGVVRGDTLAGPPPSHGPPPIADRTM